MAEQARFFFRIIEAGDGTWVCRRGRETIDRHEDLGTAFEHLHAIAARCPPSQLLVHYVDGRVETAALLD